MTFDEQDIVRRIKKDDQQAARMLYDHTVGRMASVCGRYVPNKEDVRDVLQEAYIDIFGQIDTFVYRDVGSLSAWMTRIVINRSLNFLRQNVNADEFVFVDKLPDVPDESDAEVIVSEVPIDAIYEMICELPTGYRTVFNLFVFEHLTHREIAQLLGIQEVTSASQFHRAKAFLAKRIRQYKSKQKSTP